MLIIVDYGMGNLRSVANALEAVGAAARVSHSPEDVVAADRVVLPGVGAFGEAMSRLRRTGLADALAEAVLVRKRPFLGICLGMQVLATRGLEHGCHEGLGWIEGEVQPIQPSDPALRVPHVGWNTVAVRRASPLFLDLPPDPTFYFVHGYHFAASDPSTIAGTCSYGGDMAAVIERAHIFGTQFHPEKSHHAGLLLLKNFVQLPC